MPDLNTSTDSGSDEERHFRIHVFLGSQVAMTEDDFAFSLKSGGDDFLIHQDLGRGHNHSIHRLVVME